tara:strand:- start:253 stop:645 length:393 start_codon:yes stop_codon:yes gene_type:complete
MTVKLALLKSGEDVIADIQEMMVKGKDGKDQIVGYFFRNACRATLIGRDLEDESEGFRAPFKIRLEPWMPLSKEEKIPVVSDWIISIVEPMDQLKEMYEGGIQDYENRKSQTISSSERPEDTESSGGSSE